MEDAYRIETLAEAKLAIEYYKRLGRTDEVKFLEYFIQHDCDFDSDEVIAVYKELFPEPQEDPWDKTEEYNYSLAILTTLSEPLHFDGEYDEFGRQIKRKYESIEEYKQAVDAFIPKEYRELVREWRNQPLPQFKMGEPDDLSPKSSKPRIRKPEQKASKVHRVKLDDVALPFEDIGIVWD